MVWIACFQFQHFGCIPISQGDLWWLKISLSASVQLPRRQEVGRFNVKGLRQTRGQSGSLQRFSRVDSAVNYIKFLERLAISTCGNSKNKKNARIWEINWSWDIESFKKGVCSMCSIMTLVATQLPWATCLPRNCLVAVFQRCSVPLFNRGHDFQVQTNHLELINLIGVYRGSLFYRLEDLLYSSSFGKIEGLLCEKSRGLESAESGSGTCKEKTMPSRAIGFEITVRSDECYLTRTRPSLATQQNLL